MHHGLSTRLIFISVIALLSCTKVVAQEITQTVRGTITDSESNIPLEGVVVTVFRDTILLDGAISDEFGKFVVSNIPVGRVNIRFSLMGYSERFSNSIEVTSAKEVILPVQLEQATAALDVVEIKATRDGDVTNEMAMVSARQFTVSETDRYAGSRGDPARMASNFAGVQGADDSRNDLVIRGNSPQGVLWRMDGINIPNPNHFSIPGTSGGPVSVINNKYLANSDFYTGAFPADFGNSIAGVFDLRMRNGNNESHEFSAQLGFLGTELFAEGPLSFKGKDSRNGASYIANYRYSTLQLFSLAGIDIGTTSIPSYQDGAFRLFFPGKNNSSFALWGIGGISSVDILVSEQKDIDERNIYGENDRDQYFKSKMFAVGSTWSKSFNENIFSKTSLAITGDIQDAYHELVYRHIDNNGQYAVDSLVPLLDYTFSQQKIALSSYANFRINRSTTIRAGLTADIMFWENVDSVHVIDTLACDYYQWRKRWNNNDNGFLIQPYAQIKWRLNEDWTFTGGLHASFFTITANDGFEANHSATPLEPRMAIRYNINKNQTFTVATGLHSQLQPMYMYFYVTQIPACTTCETCELDYSPQMLNRDMDFTRSTHLVLSYQVMIRDNLRLLSEVYLQEVSQVPVEEIPSSFSLVNTGAGFTRFFPGKLKNTGIATNKGLELTLEKFFSNKWLALATVSLFDSKYEGSDLVERNTDFNGKYATNFLVSREWKINKQSALITGIKMTTAGGRWYGPADEELSNEVHEVVYVDSLRNTEQFPPYFRLDVKLNYRINRKKVTHEIGLDLINITDHQNVLKLTYAPDDVGNTSNIREEYQLGFLPIFFYKIDF